MIPQFKPNLSPASTFQSDKGSTKCKDSSIGKPLVFDDSIEHTVKYENGDHFGNLRKRGGEAWRLKTHVLSLQEDIDGGSENMLKWRYATPTTTSKVCGVARELFTAAVRQAAEDISKCVAIGATGMELRATASMFI